MIVNYSTNNGEMIEGKSPFYARIGPLRVNGPWRKFLMGVNGEGLATILQLTRKGYNEDITKNGFITIGDRPGIGVELDEEVGRQEQHPGMTWFAQVKQVLAGIWRSRRADRAYADAPA
jgi:hypothetical protein